MWIFHLMRIALSLVLLATLHLVTLAFPKAGTALTRKFNNALRKTPAR